jgi:hypothetical protein
MVALTDIALHDAAAALSATVLVASERRPLGRPPLLQGLAELSSMKLTGGGFLVLPCWPTQTGPAQTHVRRLTYKETPRRLVNGIT